MKTIWELFVGRSKAIQQDNPWVSREAPYQHKLTNSLHKKLPGRVLESLHQ